MGRLILNIIALIVSLSLVSQQAAAQENSLYKVSRLSFSSNNFSDIAPVIMTDGIVFCSNRRFSAIKDRTSFDGNRLYNIYKAVRKDSSDWGKPIEFKSDRSFLFNNGPLCFAPDGKTVYFTSEVETGKAAKKRNFRNHNGIFIAELSGTNLVSLRQFKYNNPQYEVAQPTISADGKYLFFASDMPGGLGGSDLYFCELVNGEWSDPVNLGTKINSSEAENFPFMHPSGKLYFSSDRAGGIGNLDVYYSSLSFGQWVDPVILSEPINSVSDDFAFVAADNLMTGYFSSNRRRSDDIFEFNSLIIRKSDCDVQRGNSYCYRFIEENAIKFDTMPFLYKWNFGDGQSAEGPVVDHCYIGSGKYIVQLDVVNLITKEVMYNEKTDTLLVTDYEQPYISAPETVYLGQRIQLSADSTNLPGWIIGQYYWNFGDETADIGKEVNKSYLRQGTYNIQLIVTTEPGAGGMIKEACVSKNISVIRQP